MTGLRNVLLQQRFVGARERGGINVGEGPDLSEGGVDVVEQSTPLSADADDAEPDGAAGHGAFHRRGGAEQAECRRSGQGLEKRPPPHLLLFRCQKHVRSLSETVSPSKLRCPRKCVNDIPVTGITVKPRLESPTMPSACSTPQRSPSCSAPGSAATLGSSARQGAST